MNANHTRPMLAFWLVAAVAALITGLGLHDSGSAVTVRAGTPSPVSRSGTPELVLGDVLHAAPTAGATGGARPGISPAPTPGYAAGAATWVDGARMATAAAAPRPAVTPSTSSRTRATDAPTATPTAPTTSRRGHGHPTGPGVASATATATPSPASSTPVKGDPGLHLHGPTDPGASAAR